MLGYLRGWKKTDKIVHLELIFFPITLELCHFVFRVTLILTGMQNKQTETPESSCMIKYLEKLGQYMLLKFLKVWYSAM